jgi:hypothetical protein
MLASLPCLPLPLLLPGLLSACLAALASTAAGWLSCLPGSLGVRWLAGWLLLSQARRVDAGSRHVAWRAQQKGRPARAWLAACCCCCCRRPLLLPTASATATCRHLPTSTTTTGGAAPSARGDSRSGCCCYYYFRLPPDCCRRGRLPGPPGSGLALGHLVGTSAASGDNRGLHRDRRRKSGYVACPA